MLRSIARILSPPQTPFSIKFSCRTSGKYSKTSIREDFQGNGGEDAARRALQQRLLVGRHLRVDFPRPCIYAAGEIDDILEAGFLKELCHLLAAHAVVANNDDLSCRI